MEKQIDIPVKQVPAEPVNIGVDVGGTKTEVMRSDLPDGSFKAPTGKLASVAARVENELTFAPPRQVGNVVVAMAGMKDRAGTIKMTNAGIAPFNDTEASKQLGVEITLINDMEATTEGVLKLRERGNGHFKTIKEGLPTEHGNILVVAISTGLGAGSAVWDKVGKRYVVSPSENGHVGFQPQTKFEHRYVKYLQTKYPRASAELGLAGKHGIDNFIDFCLEDQGFDAPELSKAIQKARANDEPSGAVLLEYATNGRHGKFSQSTARTIMDRLGGMIGSAMRDMAMAHLASEIYLTGSVSSAMGEYFAKNTKFIDRFIHEGAQHADLLKDVPIKIVNEPKVAVMGALSLAETLTKNS